MILLNKEYFKGYKKVSVYMDKAKDKGYDIHLKNIQTEKEVIKHFPKGDMQGAKDYVYELLTMEENKLINNIENGLTDLID